ncbi:hypothetical protein CB0940_01647 [Cercospora beticola]|uniref:Uncharacterized protein n=1 Tax=Cercospora beticola TaxID=122368 RepID=A0A2G5IBP1_CERBT|nr:hypothetical protein CB0940_01647 [Cercospora beticola]PIB02276.1 hypothetical protein CB0940_01647 [Cercospora beticola]WPA97090.1 hypothetical protein RHO25_001698 [Cercospora beticola]CAK1354514.1 unnamed protein product [Cercospora beticola]
MQGVTNVLAVKGTRCGEPGCHGINRSDEEDNVLDVHFPAGASSDGTFSMNVLILDWAQERLEHGFECLIDSEHNPRSPDMVRRAHPNDIHARVEQVGLGEQRMCQVDLPELLDVDQYAGHKSLHSETSSAGTMPKQGIYRLHALAMFKSHHYIALIVMDGGAIAIDGKAGQPARFSQQTAVSSRQREISKMGAQYHREEIRNRWGQRRSEIRVKSEPFAVRIPIQMRGRLERRDQTKFTDVSRLAICVRATKKESPELGVNIDETEAGAVSA